MEFKIDTIFSTDNDSVIFTKQKVYITLVKVNNRQCVTTITGLDDDLDTNKILRAMKKLFACNGHVKKDKINGDVIHIQGDRRYNIRDFLYHHEIMSPKDDRIVIYGA